MSWPASTEYDNQSYKDDNGVSYTVHCGQSNNGKVIGTSSGTANLKQCMDACDKMSGCNAALFQTGANNCFFIGTVDTTVANSTYNVGLL